MNNKLKLTAGNVITILLVLFSAGTAWGMANARATVNAEKIEKVSADFKAYESVVEARLAKLQEATQELKVITAEIANDVKWIKDNQNK